MQATPSRPTPVEVPGPTAPPPPLAAGAPPSRGKGCALSPPCLYLALLAWFGGSGSGFIILFVPFFCDNLSLAQKTKARRDVGVLAKALGQAGASVPALQGTSLGPLVPGHLAELNRDPWGRDYVFDGRVGFVGCWGEDGAPGGTGQAADVVDFSKPPLHVRGVSYRGAAGAPRDGDTLTVELSKPCAVVNERELLSRLLVFSHLGAASTGSIALASDIAMDFDPCVDASSDVPHRRVGLEERPLPGGPLDPKLHGPAVERYLRAPVRLRELGARPGAGLR